MLRRRRSSTAVALAIHLALAGLVFLPSAAHAADNDEALQHYQRGVELFNEGAYDASLLEFERAYKVNPTYKLLYNIGQVNRQLNDYAKALDAFDQYLRDGANEIPANRKSEIRAEMVKLSGRVARLNIRSNGTGEVTVDDLVVGHFPFERPIVVNVGRRKVALRDSTKGVVTRVVDVVAGESFTVDLDFIAAPTATTPEVEKHSFPILPWIITGGLGAATIVTGVLALNKSSSADSGLKTEAASANPQIADPHKGINDAIASDRNAATGLGLVSDVLLGCTVVSGIVSGYFTYRYLHLGSETKPAAVGIGPTGATISGVF